MYAGFETCNSRHLFSQGSVSIWQTCEPSQPFFCPAENILPCILYRVDASRPVPGRTKLPRTLLHIRHNGHGQRSPVIFGGSAQLHGITVSSCSHYSVQEGHNTIVVICNPDADTFGDWPSSVEEFRIPSWNRGRGSVNRHLPTPSGRQYHGSSVLSCSPQPLYGFVLQLWLQQIQVRLATDPLQIGLHEGHPDGQNRSALEPRKSREGLFHDGLLSSTASVFSDIDPALEIHC